MKKLGICFIVALAITLSIYFITQSDNKNTEESIENTTKNTTTFIKQSNIYISPNTKEPISDTFDLVQLGFYETKEDVQNITEDSLNDLFYTSRYNIYSFLEKKGYIDTVCGFPIYKYEFISETSAWVF